MDKCSNCGQDLRENDKFCSNCGQVVEREEENLHSKENLEETIRIDNLDQLLKEEAEDKETLEEAAEAAEEGGENPSWQEGETEDRPIQQLEEEREEGFFKRLSQGQIIALSLVGVLSLIGVFFLIFSQAKGVKTGEELIDDFVQALEERDSSSLRNILLVEDGKMDLGREDFQGFFAYLDRHPGFIEDTKSSLEDQANYYKEHKLEDIGNIAENIILRKKDKEYYLEIRPYYLNLSLDEKGVDIYLDDKKLDTTDRDNYQREFGPFLPGIYKLNFELEDVFMQEEEITLIEKNPSKDKLVKEFKLDLDLVTIELSSDYDQLDLFVDGQIRGEKISSNPKEIGPLARDSRIKLRGETPWGEAFSDEVRVGDFENSIRLNLRLDNDKLVDSIVADLNNFLREDARAKEELDWSSYKSVIDPELSTRKKIISKMEEEGYYLEIQPKKVSYDLESLNVVREDGNYYGMVNIKYQYDKNIITDLTIENLDELDYMRLFLIYDEKNNHWLVRDSETIDHFNLENIKEYKF